MADPKQSLEVLDSWEGGYSLNPKDPGGETYCGISRRNWPNWEGWKLVDEYKKNIGQIHWNQKLTSITGLGLVDDFYMDNFWNKQDFKDLANQDVADKIFQHYVNMGARAIRFAQSAIGFGGNSVDGIIGKVTIAALNAYEDTKTSIEFLGAYVVKLETYYEDIITEHPQLEYARHEWMLRAKTIGKRPL